MKKIVFTVFALCLFGFSNAQSRSKGAIEITPQIGYSSSNYYGNNLVNNSPVNGVGIGVGGDYFFNNRWSLRSGLFLQSMGTQFTGYKEKLSYITIPVNANWHFGSTRKWNLNFGPSIGFLVSADGNGTDIKDLANTTQLGLNYGIGYKIEASKQISILIDYQGMSGLSDITKTSANSIKNAYGIFNVGCVFKL
jgi:hypothetical protein